VTLTVNGLGGTDAQMATIRVVSQTYTTTTRVITYTYECAASLKRSERDKLYRLTGADYRSTVLTAGSTGEAYAYTYDPVGNPVFATLRGTSCRTVHTRTLTATTVIPYAYECEASLKRSKRDAANRLDYFYEDGVLTDLGRQSPPLDSANLTLFVQIFFCDIICSTERSFPSCEGHTWFNLLGNSTSGMIQMWSFSRV
jgi:hypothetical protein